MLCVVLCMLQAARGGPEMVNPAGQATLGLGARSTGMVESESGASESRGVALLLSLQ